jgi:fibronectin type 3 domain-containing protein
VSGANFPVTLNAGQTLTLNVQFAPTVAGSASGQLTISSNSSSNPTANIGLSGTGGSHEVDLSWGAPSNSPDPVAGYNVYRAPSGSNAYQQINSSVNAPTSYADTAVTSGTTYDYVVKTVGSSGAESAPSNVTTVAIP